MLESVVLVCNDFGAMRKTKDKPVSIRLLAHDYDALSEQAKRRGSRIGTLSAELVSRSIRQISHPAICFQDTADGGYCARICGHRVSVWVVVDTLMQLGGDARKAAECLNLSVPLVLAAQTYAAEFPDEIEADMRLGKRDLKESHLAAA